MMQMLHSVKEDSLKEILDMLLHQAPKGKRTASFQNQNDLKHIAYRMLIVMRRWGLNSGGIPLLRVYA